jgi:NAD-reducing hydrogenase large subunit
MENTKKNTIVVNPITRIEGHGKITVDLTDGGAVDRVRFHVTQYRGFEVFSKGRDFREMPVITPTPTAAKLREVMHMGQFIQSHALSFFHLSSPDLLFGFDADPAIRNVAGLAQEYPDLAVAGIGMRKYGQEIIKTLGGKKVHPWHSIPGGVNRSLRAEERDGMLSALPKLKDDLRKALDLVKNYLAENAELAARFATLETSYLGLVKDGNLELYDGRIRLKSPRGRITDEFDDSEYCAHIGEHVEEWSYLKFPFYRPLGFPHGSYRVGPLGRINACDDISTPEASAELAAFRKSTDDGMVHYTLYYHYARLIEILYSMERLEELLNDPDVLGSDLRITGNVTNREGVGVVEAPRGTLIHHYEVDGKGAIERANLIVATGHNNYAMNRGVEQVARDYITGSDVKEGALNRMEHVIRCYDPCLSCSTHAVGKMPLKLEVRNSRGDVVRTVTKE